MPGTSIPLSVLNDFDITAFETSLKTMIRRWDVSKSVYNNRPKAIDAKSNKQDFVVVKVSGNIEDMGAYGRTMVSIHLFAKDIESEKNGKKLSIMYQKIVDNMPESDGRLLISGYPRIVADVGDNYGYHARILNMETLIKVKQ